MKLLSLIACAAMMSAAVLHAQEKPAEVSFWVRGNCGSCEQRIEKTLEKIEGVSDAEWNKESGTVTVTFDAAKTNREAMEKRLAEVGHATKKHEADKDAHDDLPKCCREGAGSH